MFLEKWYFLNAVQIFSEVYISKYFMISETTWPRPWVVILRLLVKVEFKPSQDYLLCPWNYIHISNHCLVPGKGLKSEFKQTRFCCYQGKTKSKRPKSSLCVLYFCHKDLVNGLYYYYTVLYNYQIVSIFCIQVKNNINISLHEVCQLCMYVLHY